MRLWKFDVTPLPGGADAYRACVDDAGRIRRNTLASIELLLRQPDGAQPARLISQLAGLNRHLERLPHFKRFKMPRQERVELFLFAYSSADQHHARIKHRDHAVNAA